MTTKRKKRPGKGAICSVLTKFIHPKQYNEDPTHRSDVLLISREERKVNGKIQMCYTFRVVEETDGPICHAVMRHFRIEKEGKREDLFDNPQREQEAEGFKEPKIKWRKSKAKAILWALILDGTVPQDPKNTTMSLEDIYFLDAEICKYSFEKFENRLRALREKVIADNTRSEEDEEALKIYVRNHEPSLFSNKGYSQWQGSTAQELLWYDLPAYIKDTNSTPRDLWMSREEYRNEYPLHAFRSKIEQEIRTEKYIRTMKKKSLEHKAN
jgi:hypothetical protein